MNQDERKTTTGYVGWAMHGLYTVGTMSFLSGFYVLFRYDDGTGAGACWIATALSFGLLLNGLLRR
jgi:hypothetical protein